MKKTNKVNPVTFFRKANEARQAKVKKSLPKAQDGGPKDKWGRSSDSEWYGFDPKTKKWTGKKALSSADLKALRHQKRGMGSIDYDPFFVKKSDAVLNETGMLTPAQKRQLKNNMNKSSTLEKIYEGLPNIGRAIGSSAADIPKNSTLQMQKKGGSIKRKPAMKKFGLIKTKKK